MNASTFPLKSTHNSVGVIRCPNEALVHLKYIGAFLSVY